MKISGWFFRSIIVSFIVILSGSGIYAGSPDEKHTPPDEQRKSRYHIGLSAGETTYFGDLKNNNLKAPFYYRYGIQLNAERDVFTASRLCVNLFYGNILGDEKTESRALNFKTTMVSPQLGLSFNFLHWANQGKLREHFSCWLFAGAEAIFFTVTGDLKNNNGKTYYYWNDGTIRDLPQNYDNTSTAAIISRDNTFETSYRNLDIDNIGKPKQFALGIPLGLSAECRFKNGIAIRIGAVYHYTFSDYLDNITSKSIGVRKGKAGTDKFIYSSLGIFYSLPAYRKKCCLTSRHNN